MSGALVARLGQVAGVTALLGSGANVRVYPLVIPERAELPAATYQLISGNHKEHVAGSSGVARPRVQITSWARSYREAEALRDAIRQAIQGQHWVADGTTVTHVSCAGDGDIPSASPQIETERLYGLWADYIVTHHEAIPEGV